MQADLDDAPEWLKPGHKKSAMRALLPWMFGICVTLGTLYVGSQAFLHGTARNLWIPPQEPDHAPIAEIYRAPVVRSQKQDWNQVVEAQAQQGRAPQRQAARTTDGPIIPGREPVLNLGYKPGEAINILSFNETYVPEEQESKSRGVRVTVVAETKDSACWPLKEGSVERRNCKFSQGLSR